jgi:hypothetical protein
MVISRRSTLIRPACSRSLSTREKYSGVIDGSEATVALVPGSVIWITPGRRAASPYSRSRNPTTR